MGSEGAKTELAAACYFYCPLHRYIPHTVGTRDRGACSILMLVGRLGLTWPSVGNWQYMDAGVSHVVQETFPIAYRTYR
jgi:hypothetical protein